MEILSIDVSQKQILIGIQHKNHFQLLLNQHLDKAELLPGLLQQSLKEQNINIRTIKRLGIMTGPGNYTSLRAGILMARSLAMFNKTSLFAKNRLEVMLYLARKQTNQNIIAIQNVRQNQYYIAIGKYNDDQIIYTHPPSTLDKTEVQKLWNENQLEIYGDWENDQKSLNQENLAYELLVSLGEWANHSSIATEPTDLTPFYIRPAVVKKK